MYHWITDGKEPPQVTLTTGMLAPRDNVAKVREGWLGIEVRVSSKMMIVRTAASACGPGPIPEER